MITVTYNSHDTKGVDDLSPRNEVIDSTVIVSMRWIWQHLLAPETGQVSRSGINFSMYLSKRIFDEVLRFDILINSKFFLIIATYSFLRVWVLKMTAYKQATIIRA